MSIVHTPADLLALSDGKGVELVHGTLVEKPLSALSAFVEIKMSTKLENFCGTHKTAVVLSSTNGIQCFPDEPLTVRKPDVSVYKKERFTRKRLAEGFVSIPPDVAVEVVSSHDEFAEIAEKN